MGALGARRVPAAGASAGGAESAATVPIVGPGRGRGSRTAVLGSGSSSESAEAPAGTVVIPALGGVAFELPETSFIFQPVDGFTAVALSDQPADSELVRVAVDMTNAPLTTTDDLVAILSDNTTSLTELDATTIGGLEARVFDLEANIREDILKISPDEEGGWTPPRQGRIWLIEHPERGLLMVTAEAFENVAETFPRILARTQTIVDTLEFVDLG